MKMTIKKTSRLNEKGYALAMTFCFLIIIGITFVGMWLWTSTNAKITHRNNTFNQSAGAAEAATEKVFTLMDREFLYGNLNSNATYYATNVPDTSNTNLWPVQYTFSDTNGNTNTIFVSMSSTNHFEPLDAQYAGLNAFAIDITNIAVATPKNQVYNVPATVQQTFQASIIPVFQFAIFYNLNLEMAPGQPLTLAGPVFCNQSIWEGSSDLNFSSTVQAVGTNNSSAIDPFNINYINGTVAVAGSSAQYSGTPLANFALGEPDSGATALTLPIGNSTNSNPTNVESVLNLPPSALSVPNDAGYAVTNQIYLYNECDIIISNAATGLANSAPSGTNITVYFDDKLNATRLKSLTPDFYQLKTPAATGLYTNYVWPDTLVNRILYTNDCATNVYFAGWSFVTNVAFYDFRETATVQALQIDISKFDTWLTNSAVSNNGSIYNTQCFNDRYHHIGSIYAYNSVPFSSTQLPAVRLINGQQLPSAYPGLTVATPFPLYVYGNYNVQQTNNGANDIGLNTTAHTYPAAMLADAVTILSSNWNDTLYTNGYPLASRNPADTTVNAAMLEGIVQTVPTATSAATGYYSGGVENFLRLLENWGGTLTYNGSIVVMFPSVYATNYWNNNGNIYSVPTRHWAFDLNFAKSDGSGMPPCSPNTRALVRGSWKTY